jgi:GT2 family glycosyltransferase
MCEKGMTAVDVSVVIVNHNHRPVVEKCFESLYSLPDRASCESMLRDNTRADGVSEWVAENYPRAEIRRNRMRRGFAANANTGIRELRRGRYALLLNPDVICLPGLLDRMVEFMDKHPRAAIAAPRLSRPDGTPEPNCRRFPTPGILAARALRIDKLWKSSNMQQYLMSKGEHSLATQVDWVTGAVLMARRSAVETVGLLDERYFLYWEDLDWCYRMRRGGWGVYHLPEARAVHAARREGVRRPLGRAQRAQIFGAIKFFREFGWNAGKVAV